MEWNKDLVLNVVVERPTQNGVSFNNGLSYIYNKGREISMAKKENKIRNWTIYMIMFVLAEIISGFCTGFSLGILDRYMPGFGDPEKNIVLTDLGNLIYNGLLVVAGLVILSLLIALTVKIKRKKGGLRQILPLWGLAIIASILGIVLALSGFSVSEMLGETLLDFFDTKFELFKIDYMQAL